MKKGLILVLAALMLAVSLTACAATQPYYDGYSNVSTTRNGYVNGTNGYGGMYNGTNYNPGYNGAGYSQSGTASGRTVTGSTSGTAMRKRGAHMTVRGFFLTMGAGVAVGALGAMMLPKNSDAYRMTKQVAKAIQNEAEKAVDAISSAM